MRYTGNANKILWYLALPILIGSYLLFAQWENSTNNDVLVYHEKHKKMVTHTHQIDGLILGGSNAFFSLSAQQLSTLSNTTWLNISHLHEAYPNNYMKLIKKTFPQHKRQSIRVIVFSSMTPYMENRMKGVTKATNSLLPNKRLASQIKRFFFKKKRIDKAKNWPPAMHANGDLDFTNSTQLCNKDKSSIAMMTESEINKDMHTIEPWLTQQLNQLTKLFPNAMIILVSPSMYVEHKNIQHATMKVRMHLHKSVGKYTNSYKQKIVFIEQPFYTSINQLCETPFHGNIDGRKWRTHDLYQRIAKYLTH